MLATTLTQQHLKGARRYQILCRSCGKQYASIYVFLIKQIWYWIKVVYHTRAQRYVSRSIFFQFLKEILTEI